MKTPHRCLYTQWFLFYECTVRTCKNFSEAVPSRCLNIDRTAPSSGKTISDAEIHIYKFSPKVSPRYVAIRRKRACARITSALVLKEYIPWLVEHKAPTQFEFKGMWLNKIAARAPLKIKLLRFESWMWPFIVDKNVYKEFLCDKFIEGTASLLEMHEVLAVSPAVFKKLVRDVQTCQGVAHEYEVPEDEDRGSPGTEADHAASR